MTMREVERKLEEKIEHAEELLEHETIPGERVREILKEEFNAQGDAGEEAQSAG